MSYPLWKNKRNWWTLGALVTLSITLGVVGWAYDLNQKVTMGLQNKKFLPPTQFFSGPDYLSKASLLTLGEVVQKLSTRHYFRRGWQDRLGPGEFAQGAFDDCRSIIPRELPPGVHDCLLWRSPSLGDPELDSENLQLVTFEEGGSLLATYQGNPLIPSTSAFLEPELIAQYLDRQPIQQTYKPLGEIPVSCLNAVLAIEDPRFLEHSGVSLTGIARAALHDILRSKSAQGGSTITQQLVKNYFLTPEKTIKRKATEFLMSLILEFHSSKDEILETYLNIIYFGQNGPFQIRGIPAAAQYYFQKNMDQLDLADCAMLAATLNSPGLYDPFRKPENTIKRRNLVLEKMLEHHLITAPEMASAKSASLPQRVPLSIAETAPYYIDAVLKELTSLSLPTTGVKVFTGLNRQAQSSAQRAVLEELHKLESEKDGLRKRKAAGENLEAVLLTANNQTGLVEALVGGRGFKTTQYNRALESHRQVGSIMKPFVYLAALENEKYSPTTQIDDVRFTHHYGNQSWSPENYEHEYYGKVPMYFALKNSLNCATAALGLQVGLENIISLAQAAGIVSPLQALPSVTLGAFELTPIEVLQAYSTLAHFGVKQKLRTLRSVLGENGEVLYQNRTGPESVLPGPATAELVGMMKQTLLTGTAKTSSKMGYKSIAAGKTGTTSDYKDSWFAGFTPNTTTVTWVGYDDNTPSGLTGASGALPIWIKYMVEEAKRWKEVDFAWPDQTFIQKTFEGPEGKKEDVELVFSRAH